MANCKSCGTPIAFLKTIHGKYMPVELLDKETNTHVDPKATFDSARHQTHFEKCPYAAKHRNR